VLYIHGKRKCVYMRTTGASSSTTSNGHWRRIVRRGSRRAHAHATSGRNVVTLSTVPPAHSSLLHHALVSSSHGAPLWPQR
jgi:hypothetical protein